jgi:hypothetical protein
MMSLSNSFLDPWIPYELRPRSQDWELEIVSSMLDVANQIDDEIPSQLRIRMNRQRKQPDANFQVEAMIRQTLRG